MRAKRNAVLLISTLGAIFAAEMVAGQAVDQLVAAENRRIQQAQAAQDQIDGIVTETRSPAEEFRAVVKEIDGLPANPLGGGRQDLSRGGQVVTFGAVTRACHDPRKNHRTDGFSSAVPQHYRGGVSG